MTSAIRPEGIDRGCIAVKLNVNSLECCYASTMHAALVAHWTQNGACLVANGRRVQKTMFDGLKVTAKALGYVRVGIWRLTA